MRRSCLALVATLIVGCGAVVGGTDAGPGDGGQCTTPTRLASPESCQSGWSLNDDRIGGLLADGGNPTSLVGDNRCYQRCDRDADCADPARPHCTIQGRFHGGDFNCNRSVRVCRCTPTDDCTTVNPP